MGVVQQAVLEFDEEVRAPWRPRLVAVPAVVSIPDSSRPAASTAAARREPSRRSPSRVGVCRPPVPTRGHPGGDRSRPPAEMGVSRPRAVVRPAGRASTGLRLTRRARRLAVLMALACGVVVGSWLAPLVSGGDQELHLAGVSSVVVEPGDTLWSIASSVADGEDVRAVVDRIQELNRLDGSALVPGQVLHLP